MKKEEILASSQKENKNKDLAELEILRHAGACAFSIGAIACCVILVLASVLNDIMLYSPWFIYFSMIGTNWLVRAIKMKKKSDWIVAIMLIILAVLALIMFLIRLSEVSA